MFRVKVNNKEISFTFRHEHFNPPIREMGSQVKALTTASVDNGSGTIIYGNAYCSLSDNFNREIGRKTALARVLKGSGLTYAERTAIWERYHFRFLNDTEFEREYKND